jgi:thioredoxin 2
MACWNGDNEAAAGGLCGVTTAARQVGVPTAVAGMPCCGKCHQRRPWIAGADDSTFGETPVVAGWRAPWCGPCRMVGRALGQLARDLAGQVRLVKADVGTSPQIWQRSGAWAIATLLVVRRG